VPGGNFQLIETSLGEGVAAGDKDASMVNTQHHSCRIILWCVADERMTLVLKFCCFSWNIIRSFE
jgi:hypothetical protein